MLIMARTGGDPEVWEFTDVLFAVLILLAGVILKSFLNSHSAYFFPAPQIPNYNTYFAAASS